MKQFKIFFVVLFFATNIFANSWYVCLASFKNETNAETFSQFLKKNKIENFIFAFKNQNGKTSHRVLFDETFSSRTSARNLRDTLLHDKKIRELNLNDLWICEAEKDLREIENDIVLAESANENEIETLQENQIDTIESETLDETEIAERVEPSLKNEIENLPETKIETLETNENEFENAPTTLSQNVLRVLNELPMNKQFQIDEVFVWDFEKIGNEKKTDFATEKIASVLNDEKNLHAATCVRYTDEVYGKSIEVFIALGDKNVFKKIIRDFEKEKNGFEKMQFASRNEIFHADFFQSENNLEGVGVNEKNNLFCKINAQNFSLDEFKQFMIEGFGDASIFDFSEIRETLFTLPDVSNKIAREFLFFHAAKIDEKYVREKGSTEWAEKIKGHWNADSFYRECGEIVSVGFFDLETAERAKATYELFKNAHSLSASDKNYADEINGESAWYVDTLGSREFSFCKNAYIIAIGVASNSRADIETLKNFAKDLRSK